MTDKQLKHLLQTMPKKEDEQFVRNVMNQLPKTGVNMRPVWGIRLVSVAIAIVALLVLTTDTLSDFFYHMLEMLSWHPSFGWMLMISLGIAAGTLWLCHDKDIV